MNVESSPDVFSSSVAALASHPLDNPIGNALLTEHQTLALTAPGALRYRAEFGPLSQIDNQTADSYSSLRRLTDPQSVVALFLHEPPLVADHWSFLRGGLLDQMIFASSAALESALASPPPAGHTIRPLTPEDVPAMLELATLTEPGPFQQRTIELGLFLGAFVSNRLVAMAGQRLHLPDYVEVSAVCTHPTARGRGLARLLMARIMDEILSRGKTPFLHSFSHNEAAIRVYRDLGFIRRRNFHLAVLQNNL